MNELEWLTDRRPEVEPDARGEHEARAALLRHIAAPPRVDAPRRRPADLWPRSKGGLYALAAVVLAVMIAIGAGALPTGDGPTRVVAPEPADAARLKRLSARIQAAPAPRGDATLVQRRHAFPDGRDFTGADLYLDDGRYFYDDTRAGLRDAAPQEDFGQFQVAAAKAANELPAERARERMIDAAYGAKGEPAEQPPPKKARPGGGPAPTPAPQTVVDNNRVWIGSMDALIAGAGRADVRAGVMKLLATIPEVRVRPGAGELTIANADFPDGYVETLVVDDRTGILKTMTGGYPGKRPDVVVTYEIERVEARDLLR